TADITKLALTVTAKGVNKVYDRTTAASVQLSDDHLAGDDVVDHATALFADKNVEAGKTVSVFDISISGTDAGNYNLQNTTTSTTADITKLDITGSFTADNKVYNGTT